MYSNAWTQRQLGTIFEQTSTVVNPEVENLELWSLTVQDGLTPKTERYQRDFLVKKEDQFKAVHPNEFIYNPMNMTLGSVDLNTTSKTVAVSGYYTTMIAKEDLDSVFLKVWLKSEIALQQYRNYATGSLIERQRVQFPTLCQIEMNTPSLSEQWCVGEFFRALDELIAINQNAVDRVQRLKSAYLQQLFPKSGQTVPHLRFSGFTSKWSKFRFGDLYKVNLERNGDQFGVDRTISIALMYFNESGNGASADSLQSYKVLRQGDIAFEGHTSKEFAFGRFVMNDIGDGIMSPRFTALRPIANQDVLFWKYYIHYEPVMRKVLVSSTKKGTMMNELVVEDFLAESIPVPSLSEQQAIGALLGYLDGIIATRCTHVEQLQNLKRGYLQRMLA